MVIALLVSVSIFLFEILFLLYPHFAHKYKRATTVGRKDEFVASN